MTELRAKLLLAAMAAVLLISPAARAMPNAIDGGAPAPAPSTRPALLDNIGIDQHLGAQIPGDLVFRDYTGREVKLADYFARSNRPIILTLVYYRCPMLCTMVLNELVRTMNGMSSAALPMQLGKDYDVLTVSFDARETPELADEKRTQYLREYHDHDPQRQASWNFLVGKQGSIDALTKAAGFRYAYDPKFDQYVHASAIIILTPDGKISRYFYGIDYTIKDVRLTLVEASHNKVGGVAEQIMLYCFHYDPTTGKYSLSILRLLRGLGALTLLAVGGYVFANFRRDFKAQRAAALAAAGTPAAAKGN